MIKLPVKVCVEDNATPLARVVLHFMGGSSEDPPGKEGLTSLTNRLLLRGTETLCRAKYEDQLEQLGVNLVPTCSASSLSIGGSLHKRHAARWFEFEPSGSMSFVQTPANTETACTTCGD